MRSGSSPWSAPSAIGLNVLVVIVGRTRRVLIQRPIASSLRPPPYASAVSKCVIPIAHAASISSIACSSVRPWPKNAGAEPMPPKLPQPSAIRGIVFPELPSGRCSISSVWPVILIFDQLGSNLIKNLGRSRAHANLRAGVVDVALGIPQRSLVLGLGRRRRVPGTYEQLMLARRQVQRDAPVPPSPSPKILQQARLCPAHAAVGRDVDPADVPISAGKRIATHLYRAGGDGLAVTGGEDVGVERHQAERHAGTRAGGSIGRQEPVDDMLEVTGPRFGPQLDALEPLDAARADIAGHNHAQRCAVHRCQRLAVHRPGEQYLRTRRLVERYRAAEPLDGLGLRSSRPRPRTPHLKPRASGPASASTSASATPVQVAVPVAPGPHGASPGMSRMAISPARRLPAH